MRQITKLFFWVILSIPVLMACDKDDDVHPSQVPVTVTDAMIAKYPEAIHVEWEYKQNYYMADCLYKGSKMKAWFNTYGVWVQTELEIGWIDLPKLVQESFRAGKYASWFVEDLEELQFPLNPNLYMIEVENGEREVQLFYSVEGNQVKEIDITGKEDTLWPHSY